MKTIMMYRCENCKEVHHNKEDIFKCASCDIEICIYCCIDGVVCDDDCEG